MRREFPKAVRAAAFLRSKGHCEECGTKLLPGRFAYDHVLPDGLGGEPTLENCAVLCSGGRATCHGIKTAERDVPATAKADRIREKHLGIRKPKRPFPGSRADTRRRRMDGEVVERNQR